MPLIDSVSKADIMQRAQQTLVKRTLGGVTQESAVSAINQAANEAVTEGNKRIASLELEVGDKNSKISSLQGALNTERSKLEQVTKTTEDLQSKLDIVNQQLKESNGIKVGKPKTLPNGNIETIRTNRNGFRETKETLADGETVVSKKFENIDGDILKITYNPTTGKPLKVFSNINGDTLKEYNDGKAVAERPVNNKKVAPKKPEVIATEVVKDESNKSNGISEIRKTYSDGSYDYIQYSHYRKHPLKEVKRGSNGKVIQETEYNFYDKYNVARTKVCDPETQHYTLTINKYMYKEGFEPQNVYVLESRQYIGKDFKTNKKVVKYSNGLVQIIEAKKDEYGFCNYDNPSMKFIYPKTSKIKTSEVTYRSQFYAQKEILKLRDGSKVELNLDSDYRPYDVMVTSKDGNTTKIDSRDEISTLFKDIGKLGYSQIRDYYSNTLN